MVSKFSDVAVGDWEEDKIGFKAYAEGVIDTIERSKEDAPFTIGIFGSWGSGKTSFMRIMQELLKSRGYKTIFFDSWKYGNEEKPWLPLMIKVEDELKLIENKLDKKELMRNIFLFSTDVALQTFSQGKISTGGILDLIERSRKISPNKVLSNEDTKKVIERVTKIEEFKKKIMEKAEESPKGKIIIFIDHLDRIPEKIIDFLNNLTFFLDIKGCVFILGCDYKILDSALKQRYREEIYEDYFDKIVQSKFFIPKISEQAIKEYLQFLTGWSDWEVGECTQLVIHSIGGNPRKIKKVVNESIQIKNVFENKLAMFLRAFERPKPGIWIKRGEKGEEIEELMALESEITTIFTPTKVFDILFDEIAIFKLVCLREQWFDLYESILSDEEKQHALISFQEDAETDISKLIKANEEKLLEIKKKLPEFLNKEPNFEGVEDLTTYLNLLGISSPEVGLSLEYPEPEKLPDKVFNRIMVFERINKGKVEEDIIEKKINNMDWKSDLDSIYFFIKVILSFGYNNLIKCLLTNEETPENIAEKIRESKDPEIVGDLLDSVRRIDEEVARWLLAETKDTYAEKIRGSKDPGAVKLLLYYVDSIDTGIARELLAETKDTYAEKIRESKDPEAVEIQNQKKRMQKDKS